MIIKWALNFPNRENLTNDDFENVFKYFVEMDEDLVPELCVEYPVAVLEFTRHDCL